jgi:hypothetical protein
MKGSNEGIEEQDEEMEVKSFDFLDFMGLVMNFLFFFIKVNVF